MSLTCSVVMVQIVSSRGPSTVQTGRAGRTVSAGRRSRQDGRCGATAATPSADVALQSDTDRAAATRRTFTSWTLSQINALIFHRQLMTVIRMRK